MLKHFYGSMVFTILSLAAAAAYGWFVQGGMAPMLQILWICVVLSVLEVSLSFDNAVVNATVLKDMAPIWQRRFLTWGILIAVFGMRIVFPVLIVAIAGSLGPIEAVQLSLNDPERYAAIVTDAHESIMGFGGAFLMLVGMKFFFDSNKKYDWIGIIERPLRRLADLEAAEIMIVLALLYTISLQLPEAKADTFFFSGMFGIFTFFAVEWVSASIKAPVGTLDTAKRAGFGAFLYLEVLDASFSFDGVIGAFALTNNLIVIAIGLGIGAMFVRSMTIALVKQGTLGRFRFLEHGAFWAILALSVIMFLNVIVHIPETVTGLIGGALIGLSLLSSVRFNSANGD